MAAIGNRQRRLGVPEIQYFCTKHRKANIYLALQHAQPQVWIPHLEAVHVPQSGCRIASIGSGNKRFERSKVAFYFNIPPVDAVSLNSTTPE
jgi:hypothetical protein